MKKLANIYDMELHTNININGHNITRVPGGWIYATNRQGSDLFIPFDNEFQDQLKRKQNEHG